MNQRYVLTFSPKNGKPRVLKPSMTQKKKASLRRLRDSGDPAAIRTQDLLLRRQLLYPAELRGHHYFVGTPRFELGVSCSQSRRDNRTTLHPVDVHKKNASFWGAFLRRRGLQNATFREFSAEIYCFISAVLDTFLKPLTFTYKLLFQTFRVAFRVARSATFADAFSLQRYKLFSTYQIIC